MSKRINKKIETYEELKEHVQNLPWYMKVSNWLFTHFKPYKKLLYYLARGGE